MPVTADVKTGVNFVSLLMSKRVSISCQFRVNFVSISCHGILDIPDQKALQYVQSDDNLPFSRPSLPANMQISRLSSVPLQSDYPSPPASPPQRGEQQSTAEQGQSKVRARQEQGRSMAGTPQEQGWPTAEQGRSMAGTPQEQGWPTAEQGRSMAGTPQEQGRSMAGARSEHGKHGPRSPFSLIPQAQRQAGTAALPGIARHCLGIARHGRGVASLPRCFSRARERPTHEHGPAAAGCRGDPLSRRRLSTFCAEPRRLLHPAPSGGVLSSQARRSSLLAKS
jgi:hypothetical protein